MSKLEFKPQDRQSIDFAEEERVRFENNGKKDRVVVDASNLSDVDKQAWKEILGTDWKILEGEAETPIIIPMSWDKVKEFCFRVLGNDQATFGYKHVAKEFWHNDGTYGVLVESINEHGSCKGGLVFSISNKSWNSFQLNASVRNGAMTGFKVGYR